MIIVKNRELLIPEPERYIGTTYDTESEIRQFLISRFAQNGVDLSALTFHLDLKYANDAPDTVLLDKEVTDTNIILTWNIGSSVLQVPGTLFIQLRAADDEVTVKWSSFHAAIYVERHLNTPGTYTGSLTEIEQMEQDHQYMKGVVDELKNHLDYTHEAEGWAIGKKDGEDVQSTDETYHNNSKYYSEQAGVSATAAANSATAAAGSATQAAATVADTNTRFDNAVAAVTVNTEVQDARVGADGTTYTVLKNRLDAEHTDVKSAIGNITSLSFTDRGYIATVASGSSADLTPVANNYMSYMVTDCSEGQKFYLSGTAYSNSSRRPYMFVDSSGTCISRSSMTGTLENVEVVAPANAAKLVVNFRIEYSKSVYANGLPDLNARVTEIAENKVDKVSFLEKIPDISILSLDYQQETVHHDNFHRDSDEEYPWHIGENGTTDYPMTYSSLEDDYATVDDGFRISNNTLVAVTGTTKTNAMRVIDNAPSSNILIEIGIDSDLLGNDSSLRSGIAYNIADSTTFEGLVFALFAETGYITITKIGFLNGQVLSDNGNVIYNCPYTGKSVRMLLTNDKIYVWFDDSYQFALDASFDTDGKIGLLRYTNSNEYRWRFVNVHEIVPTRVLDAGLANERGDMVEVASNGARGNDTVTQTISGSYYDYLYNPDTTVKYFSEKSDCFDLKYLDEDRNGSRRSELRFRNINTGKLRKFKLEFDVYFPASYVSDTVLEIICQVLCSSNVDEVSYNPSFSIRTYNDRIGVHLWGQSLTDSSDHEEDDVYYFADVEREKWIHFEIYIKEGYMAGHCPITIIKMDGNLVYRSEMINTVNTATGAAIKYGIYKSLWYEGTVGNVTERKLYFDNVRLTI